VRGSKRETWIPFIKRLIGLVLFRLMFKGIGGFFQSIGFSVGSSGSDAVAAEPGLSSSSRLKLLLWPYPSPGFILQQHTNLSTTNWIASTNEIHEDLDYYYKFITVSLPIESRYYRLFRP